MSSNTDRPNTRNSITRTSMIEMMLDTMHSWGYQGFRLGVDDTRDGNYDIASYLLNHDEVVRDGHVDPTCSTSRSRESVIKVTCHFPENGFTGFWREAIPQPYLPRRVGSRIAVLSVQPD
jgi:hypothetical protein